jgi:hypothetical protein
MVHLIYDNKTAKFMFIIAPAGFLDVVQMYIGLKF